MSITRRKFIKNASATAIVAPFASLPFNILKPIQSDEPLEIHLFSKLLQFLDIKEAAQISAEMGFDGLDLTVRPKGHILPENVVSELPSAIRDIKAAGLSCKMIATAISDVDNPYDVKIIEAAAKEGIQFYRSAWFKYHKDKSMEESMSIYQRKVKELCKVNKKYNMIGCYQNHAGTSIGSSFWELKQILEKANPDYFGLQYDIRHAVVDGGLSWTNGLKLLKNDFKTIALKDFTWEQKKGKWKPRHVPVGEGMVDFDTYFKFLKSNGLKPPVTLHVEHYLGGAEKGKREISVDKEVVFDAMKKDLVAIQKLWKEA
jgi:sugar phosphate isomerase/epimerase